MGHTIILVDDEPAILAALERVFLDEDYDIHAFSNGAEAIEFLKCNDISLIISDQRMPNINGVELLEQVFALRPDAARIILTGYSDRESTIGAINRGHANQYILKPWNNDELRRIVASRLKEFDLRAEVNRLQKLTADQNEQLRQHNERLEEMVNARTRELHGKNKELESSNERLKNSYNSSIKLLGNTIEMCDPSLGSHGIRVASHAMLLGRRLGLDSDYCGEIYVAGLLHDLGMIGVPHAISKKYKRGLPMEKAELEMITNHPITGEKLFRLNESGERVGKMIRSHHENYDGSGYPDGLTGLQIMVGAQVIAITDRYDELICRAADEPDFRLHQEAVNQLKASRECYDPDLLQLYIELLDNEQTRSYVEKVVSLSQLEEGMILSRHVYSNRSMLLLPRGAKLNEEQLERLKYGRLLAPDTKIYVYDVQFDGAADQVAKIDHLLAKLAS